MITRTSLLKLVVPLSLTTLLIACGEAEPPAPELRFEESFQAQLINAQPGDVIEVPAGVHEFTRSLSLNVPGVTLRGAGMDVSVLSFKNQVQGAEGLLVTADDFTIEDLAIEDTVGDALKVNESTNVIIRRVRTEWTGGALTENGAYGIYPVQCTKVLIEGSVAIGASDAGIYVGQSSQIIVRNSRAEYNVAGIEIENSYYADVYDNIASHNTGGILVFDLPNLPQQGGHHVRVFRNKVVDNDTDNFAPEGNIVGEVPRGTGIIIQANSDVEVFDNDISGNGTVNLSIVTYGAETEDEKYYPHPKSIQVHGNRFGSGGFNPDLDKQVAAILFEVSKGNMPDIFWDGVLPLSEMIFGQPKEEKLVLSDNGEATFLAIKPIKFMLSLSNPITRDQSPYLGEIRALSPVIIDLPEGI